MDKAKVRETSLEINRLSNSVKSTGNKDEIYSKILQNIPLYGSKVSTGSDSKEMFQQILEGNTIILFDGIEFLLTHTTYGPEGRVIQEPTSQAVIRGPEEGFTEKIENDISQIRRRTKGKFLWVGPLKLGTITKTDVVMLYMEGTALESNIEEVRKRLPEVQIDGILEGQNTEELIQDDTYSLFPATHNTERPDNVSAALLEGRIAIMVDGIPYVSTVPTVLIGFFIPSEDYYHSVYDPALFRLVRLFSFFLTVFMSGIYTALMTLDRELIPTPLLLDIAVQHEGVPLSTFWEGILVEITSEVLREAEARMPRAIGPAISIVGALMSGQAAVQAGSISAATVIVISITAIASSCIPNTAVADAPRMTRFIIIVLTAYMGLYRVFIYMFGLVLHLCKLKLIGMPYMTPVAPVISERNTDRISCVPLWA